MKIQLLGFIFKLRVTVFALLSLIVPTAVAADVEVDWNTFVGSYSLDYGNDIVVDDNGNVYVTGISFAPWGSPVIAYAGYMDALVAKFDSSGNLSWSTFLGSSNYDYSESIAVDKNGNVYVTGHSYETWGDPVNSHSGDKDVFVAQLDSSGNLNWNTFLGSSGYDYGRGLVVDKNSNVYVTGYSNATWGVPVNPHAGDNDAFVTQLSSSGNLNWNTFLGSSGEDYGESIVVGENGNVYVTGYSHATWGVPINPYTGDKDAFVAQLSSSGNLSWNTFLGSSGEDSGEGIVVDENSNVYVTGISDTTWGSPVNPHAYGSYDAFVVKFNNSGNLSWNTFLDSSGLKKGLSITIDDNGNVYVSGTSDASWGNPVNPHAGSDDAFVAQLSSSGDLSWNTFLGSSTYDYGNDIAASAVDKNTIYVTGGSGATWSTPISDYNGAYDIFVAKLSTPVPSYLQFSLATFQAAENSGQVVIKVSRTENSNGAVSIDYASSDDTATASVDYTATAGTLTWDDGESGEKSFMVNLLDDNEMEGNESIILTLDNITGEAVLGSPQMATLIIVDDDQSGSGCKHAIYSLDDQTLAIPAVEVPILSIIDQQPTGESVMLTSILKQQPTEPTQFGIWFLSEVFPEVIVAASVCPASYSLTSGVLSLPWVEIPVVAQLGSQQSEVGVEVFRVIMQWQSDLDLFVVEEIQRVE